MKGYIYYPNEPEPGVEIDGSLESFKGQANQKGVSFWLDVKERDLESEANQIGEALDLHHLTVEDITTTESRPIVDTFQDYLYILARIPARDWEIGEMETYQLSIILGSNYLLTFHRRDLPSTRKLKSKLTEDPG